MLRVGRLRAAVVLAVGADRPDQKLFRRHFQPERRVGCERVERQGGELARNEGFERLWQASGLEAALRGGHEHCCIFEDDAEVVGAVKPYLAEVGLLPAADLIFLGVNEIVDGEPSMNPGIHRVERFWGTHAVIVGRKAMTAIFEVYTQSLKDGYALPADWLYSFAIKEKGLVAYAPQISVVRQRPGLMSLTSGNVRG